MSKWKFEGEGLEIKHGYLSNIYSLKLRECYITDLSKLCTLQIFQYLL